MSQYAVKWLKYVDYINDHLTRDRVLRPEI